MRRPSWKKPEAKATLDAIAQDIAEFFALPVPPVAMPEGYTGREWEYRTPTVEVWTKAGRAELNISISGRFAHLYFRFDDPARAIPFDFLGRLNRFSGKWNRIATPIGPDELDIFRAYLRRDFRKVAEPNPPADEVAAYRAKEAASAARFAEYIATFHA